MSFQKILELEQFSKEAQSIVKEYIYPLCKGLYWDPIVDCCGHLFCRDCIEASRTISNTCPLNKTTKLSREFYSIPFITQLFDKYQATCKYDCG
jgi:hypothetical protein